MTDKLKTKYQAERIQHLRELRRIYQFDDRFRDAIVHAYRKNTGPLRDLLYSDMPLSSEQREMLAALIRWGIEPKQRGRPRGSVPVPNPARDNERQIVARVRELKLRRRRASA
jgi:hypothetical protein